MESSKINTAKLRKYLNENFSASELEAFLFDHFPAIYNDITPEMPQTTRVLKLLGYCERHRRYPKLLDILKRERPSSFRQSEFIDTPKTEDLSSVTEMASSHYSRRNIDLNHINQQSLQRETENLYKQLRDAIAREAWTEALHLIKQIQERNLNFRDVPRLSKMIQRRVIASKNTQTILLETIQDKIKIPISSKHIAAAVFGLMFLFLFFVTISQTGRAMLCSANVDQFCEKPDTVIVQLPSPSSTSATANSTQEPSETLVKNGTLIPSTTVTLTRTSTVTTPPPETKLPPLSTPTLHSTKKVPTPSLPTTQPPTAIKTSTPPPPTATNTRIPSPPTATDTPLPPLPTATDTPIPITNTPIPPTPTKFPTATLSPPPTATATSPPPQNPVTRPIDGMVMFFVSSGSFMMGSDGVLDADESPMHQVSLDSFWIDKTEVTNAQFATFVTQTGYQTTAEKAGGGRTSNNSSFNWIDGANWQHPYGPDSNLSGLNNHPVVLVSYVDASAYCAWAGGQLPTAAQWEYAARGPSNRTYPWGNSFDGTRANYCDVNCFFSQGSGQNDGYAMTAPVGSYPAGASWIGALDMSGNVREWVADWFSSYPSTPQSNPTGPPTGTKREMRGGSWYSLQENVRGATRREQVPEGSTHSVYSTYGFRCMVNEVN